MWHLPAITRRPFEADGAEISVCLPPCEPLFWIAGADILYACEDLEFDRSKGLKSVPASLGLKGALVVSALCHVVTVAALAAAGWKGGLGGWWFATSAAIAATAGGPAP